MPVLPSFLYFITISFPINQPIVINT